MSCGGIGIRRSVQLPPSTICPLLWTVHVISQILPSSLKSLDPHVEHALNVWHSTHNHIPPSLPSACHQSVWDSIVVGASFEALLDSALDTESRARFMSVSCSESGAWLQALHDLLSVLGWTMCYALLSVYVWA